MKENKIITLENLKKYNELSGEKTTKDINSAISSIKIPIYYHNGDASSSMGKMAIQQLVELIDADKPFCLIIDGCICESYGKVINEYYFDYTVNTNIKTSNGVSFYQKTKYKLTYDKTNYTVKKTVAENQNIINGNSYEKIIASDNTTAWTPSTDYGLVHKKYVDDAISGISVDVPIYYFDGDTNSQDNKDMFAEIYEKYQANEPFILQYKNKGIVTDISINSDSSILSFRTMTYDGHSNGSDNLYGDAYNICEIRYYPNDGQLSVINSTKYIISSLSSLTNILSKTNTQAYKINGDYTPVYKKYVDDLVASSGGTNVHTINVSTTDNNTIIYDLPSAPDDVKEGFINHIKDLLAGKDSHISLNLIDPTSKKVYNNIIFSLYQPDIDENYFRASGYYGVALESTNSDDIPIFSIKNYDITVSYNQNTETITPISAFTSKTVKTLGNGIGLKAVATKTYVRDTVNTAIGSLEKLTRQIITSLDEITEENVIYMILKETSSEDDDIYDEYMLINGKKEKIGSTSIDFEIATDEDIDALFE